jgi:type VI secretion system protein ImpF
MALEAQDGEAARRKRTRRVHERSRVALFDVFRDSFVEGKKRRTEVLDDRTHVPFKVKSNSRRLGVDEQTLRAHVHQHLYTLMNNIRLDAAIDLTDCPNISSSILNYGFCDLSDLSKDQIMSSEIEKSIKKSLSDHEPRLVKRGIEVKIGSVTEDLGNRLFVQVSANLIADPADIPVDYEADIDTGSGKFTLSSAQRRDR